MRTQELLIALALPLLHLAGCSPGQGEELGRVRYENCAPCHGADGSGNSAIGAPAIAGMPAWYVEAQLHKFRNGGRGAHPDDVEGLKMRPMARTLLGEEDLTRVSAHVAKMAPARPAATLTGDAARGKILFAPCVACHGERGIEQRDKATPSLQRTGDFYLLAQLKKFKAGVRGTGPGDTTGAQMQPMAATLPNEQAMRDVIAYIKTLEQ